MEGHVFRVRNTLKRNPPRALASMVGSEPVVLARIIPFYFDLAPAPSVYYPIYAKCIELGLPLTIDTGIPGPPAPAARLKTSAYAPKYFPPELLHFMNTRGQDKVTFASDHPRSRWNARSAKRAPSSCDPASPRNSCIRTRSASSSNAPRAERVAGNRPTAA